MNIFTNAIDEIIDKKSLMRKLNSGKKLRIKLGVDPSAPDLHLGHYIVLKQLKKFDEADHKIIFLIGDATAKIGDPSGKKTERPVLSDEQIKANVKTYINQVGLVIDINKSEIRYNSEWYGKLTFFDWLKVATNFSANQILERDDFTKRLSSGNKLSIQEIMYPMMQAYDSVQLKADVELGGTDQKFNMLAGRSLQRKLELPEQDVITIQLLVGLDGKRKMSKSLGNYIGLTDSADEIFGKIMSIQDELVANYARLIFGKSLSDLEKLAGSDHPKARKEILAREVVELFHRGQGNRAQIEFDRIYSKRQTPSEMPAIQADSCQKLKDILMENEIVESSNAIKRLAGQKAIKIDGNPIEGDDIFQTLSTGSHNIKIGKRKFIKVIVK